MLNNITLGQFVVCALVIFAGWAAFQVVSSLLNLITNGIDFLNVLMTAKAKKLLPDDEEEVHTDAIGFRIESPEEGCEEHQEECKHKRAS